MHDKKLARFFASWIENNSRFGGRIQPSGYSWFLHVSWSIETVGGLARAGVKK